MKTIEQLEQEANEARDMAIALHDVDSTSAKQRVDSIILASVAMMTYQLALAEKKQEDAGGWIRWRGGECPVDPKTMVEVKLNTFDSANPVLTPRKEKGLALSFYWLHDVENGIITHYRVVKS